MECKWGDAGLEEIIKDSSITGVAVVLAGQTMVYLSVLSVCFYMSSKFLMLKVTNVGRLHLVTPSILFHVKVVITE